MSLKYFRKGIVLLCLAVCVVLKVTLAIPLSDSEKSFDPDDVTKEKKSIEKDEGLNYCF